MYAYTESLTLRNPQFNAEEPPVLAQYYIGVLYKIFKTNSKISNLVNKTNLVHNLFLVYLSISTCFGRIWAHHQEK